jgi:hypothetical protein
VRGHQSASLGTGQLLFSPASKQPGLPGGSWPDLELFAFFNLSGHNCFSSFYFLTIFETIPYVVIGHFYIFLGKLAIVGG